MNRLSAMISSTAIDLPEHRKQVVDACLRTGVFPIGMEQLPARDATAVQVSLEMVDKADIYIGIYAWRYGWIPELADVPNPDRISITEMEFNRALERKERGELKEILIFIMHDDHPIRARDKEDGAEAQQKLRRFKERASANRIRLAFQSPEELRGHVVQSLNATVDRLKQAEAQPGKPRTIELHPPSNIPAAPTPYIAHPYSLLQTKQVVGRQTELNLLTDWVTTNRQIPADVRIFNMVAIGGMGKSALTWKWFNDIAPNELSNRAGWMWWSFYESDAHYENFIIRALAYATGQNEETIRKLSPPDREDQLLRLLDEKPLVLVLDGLERILLAYSRMDAAHLPDDDLDEQTANRVAHALGLPESAAQSFIGKHNLRLTADRRAGQFLRRLARVRASRVLITTRLYPTELQADTGDPLPGSFAYFINGLTDDDALNLWREFKITGSREQLLPLFRSFGNYPLLIRALAGEVAGYRPAPGDFDRWRKDNPDFNPAKLPLKNAKTHVLEYALRGLGDTQRQVLHTLAAFRMPTTWDTLRALLAGEGKPCTDDGVLDTVLTELEDRGLMGWDKKANRYDLHPIVRGVVWAALAPAARQGIYRDLHTYFSAVPRPPAWKTVAKIEDLTPGLELFNALVGMARYDDACELFFESLDKATNYRLSVSRLRIQLLSPLTAKADSGDPRLQVPSNFVGVFNALGNSHQHAGDVACAVCCFQSAAAVSELSPLLSDPDPEAEQGLCNALRLGGYLRESYRAGLRALECWKNTRSFEKGRACVRLGAVFAACGTGTNALTILTRARRIAQTIELETLDVFAMIVVGQCHLWSCDYGIANDVATRVLELMQNSRYERDAIRARRLMGTIAAALGNSHTAENQLQLALTRARAIDFIEEELRVLTALAELHRQRKQHTLARELLDQVWSPAQRGPYPLLHADARNTLARIERDENHRDAAIAAATRAYELAWCDGPPYAYHYGLAQAKRLLAELRAPEPALPPFDESKFEPLPDVDINPKDEFWVDPATLDTAP